MPVSGSTGFGVSVGGTGVGAGGVGVGVSVGSAGFGVGGVGVGGAVGEGIGVGSVVGKGVGAGVGGGSGVVGYTTDIVTEALAVPPLPSLTITVTVSYPGVVGAK